MAQATRQALKADPPLIIDSNAVLTLSVALQGFKSVAGQGTNVLKLSCRFQAIQLEPGSAFNSRERFNPLTGCEFSGPLVPVADDHTSGITDRYVLRQA